VEKNGAFFRLVRVHDQQAALGRRPPEEPAMAKGISNAVGAQVEPVSLSELIHQHVRVAIETAVYEELRTALGAIPYERSGVRRDYRNGTKARTLTGPTGPVALTGPRATLFDGAREWTSMIVPRYQRRMPEVNEAVIATYLAGGNTRRIRGALQPLLKAAPLSKSAVSRVIATLKDGLAVWRTRSLADLDVICVYLDGFALRVRTAGKVVSVPVLGVIGVLPDGHKHLLALDLRGGESFAAWKGCLDDLVARGLRAPVLAIIDGNAGLRRAVGEIWPRAAVPRCCVHKLRNLERKAPKHVLADIRDDFHRIATPAVLRPPVPLTRPSSAPGASVVRPSWQACERAATNCSHSSHSRKPSGRHSGPQTPLKDSTRNSVAA
jgi:transposase-like protein